MSVDPDTELDAHDQRWLAAVDADGVSVLVATAAGISRDELERAVGEADRELQRVALEIDPDV